MKKVIIELIVTQYMSGYKAKMIELGDLFIIFPGGTGTLEEIAKIMSKVPLGQLDALCPLYTRDLLAYMIRKVLFSEEQ